VGENEQLHSAWYEAASDLGLRIEARGSGVLVHDFGSPAGTLCVLMGAPVDGRPAIGDGAVDSLHHSQLSESYLVYDRELFVATLNDWGWHGRSAPPSWYTGEPWT
jgi:hypothetical protein